MRDIAASLLFVCGLALIAAGLGLMWLPLGVIAAGLALVLLAVAITRMAHESSKRTDTDE